MSYFEVGYQNGFFLVFCVIVDMDSGFQDFEVI